MKRIILSILLVLSAFVANSQKTDYVWKIGNSKLDFNSNPIQITCQGLVSPINTDCICDKDGKFLYFNSGNKLYNSKEEEIHTRIGAILFCPSLIPFPGDESKTLYFYSDYNLKPRSIVCYLIDNKTDELTLFHNFNDHFVHLNFVQKRNSNDIWMIRNRDQKTTVSLITESGITDMREYDFQFDPVLVSNDGKYVYGSRASFCCLTEFDNENGILSNPMDVNISAVAFSASSKYLYSLVPEDLNNSIFDVCRYRLDVPFDEIVSSKEEVFTNINSGNRIKLGPDGNIYLINHSNLSIIKDADSKNPIWLENALDLCGEDKYPNSFPFTFHYTPSSSAVPPSGSHTACLNSSTDYFIDNPVEGSKYVWNISPSGMGEVVSNSESYDKISVKWKKVGNAEISVYEVNSSGCNSDASTIEVKVLESPDAQFDNATLCYGEPLNVILSGESPFTLEYSLNNENFSIFDINANIYQMPETAGKYSIIKVIDKNCSTIPENNNNAVIGKQMKPLKIMIGE